MVRGGKMNVTEFFALKGEPVIENVIQTAAIKKSGVWGCWVLGAL